jgi:predicted Zn-dependent protease
MFSTHPMSEERYQTAVQSTNNKYSANTKRTLYRDRYMDKTARIRRMKNAIEAMQAGEKEMASEKFAQAKTHFQKALNLAPDDYAGLLMMAKCHIALEKPAQQ